MEMGFDSADLNMMQRDGTLKSVILHEMGHVLGIGTLWRHKRLLKGAGTPNPVYVGSSIEPDLEGTWITNEKETKCYVQSLALKKNQLSLTIDGHESLRRSTFLKMAFELIERNNISLDLSSYHENQLRIISR